MLSVWTFLELLGEIPDPRRKEGKKYKLPYILLLSILAIVSGANSYRGICTFIEVNRLKLNDIFGLGWSRAPAYTAIRYILLGLDPSHIEQAFRKHAQRLESAKVAPERASDEDAGGEVKVLALDGKVLKHSFDNFHDRKAAQILSAFSSETRLILAHIEIDEKSNEIPAAQHLLSELKMDGLIVTLDAIHCQKKTFQAAVDAGAQLIVQLKDNQPTLREKTEEAAASNPIDVIVTRDQGHNRDETRKVAVFDAKDAVEKTEWEGLVSSIVVVTRDTYKKNSKTGLFERAHSVAYYLATKPESAKVFAEAIRKHWGIENRSHYPRDVTFDEDGSRIRVKPGVMARLRSFAFNILSFNKIGSYAQDRFRTALGGLNKMLSLAVS